MKGTLSLEEFAENVARYVKDALPEELSEAKVQVSNLNLWDDDTRTVLWVIRPWHNIQTGFGIDKQHKEYVNGNITVESTAANIINDRRLYNISLDNISPQQCAAVIYE